MTPRRIVSNRARTALIAATIAVAVIAFWVLHSGYSPETDVGATTNANAEPNDSGVPANAG